MRPLQNLPILAAFGAAAFWTISNIVSKKASVDMGSVAAAAIVVPLGIIPMIIGATLVGSWTIPLSSAVLASISGIFLAVGFILIYRSLQTEQLTNTVVLNEMTPAILVLFGLFALGEHVNMIQALSMVAIFAGAFFMISVGGFRINRRLIPATFAVLSWSIYWIILTYAVTGAGGAFALPVIVSRAAGAGVALAYLAIKRKEMRSYIGRKFGATAGSGKYMIVFLLALAAMVDASGDFLFSYVTGTNALAIGSALTALTPMAAAFIGGLLIYKDKLTDSQLVGFVIMVAGALVLSLA